MFKLLKLYTVFEIFRNDKINRRVFRIFSDWNIGVIVFVTLLLIQYKN